MADIHLHLIAYDESSRSACEPGYRVLDNLANLRPDWREYWPMREFLTSQAMDEQALYGFFSPKFFSKTGLSHAQTVAVIEQAMPQADIVTFSPQPDMGAFFLNVFEQGETFDPGLIDAFQAFLSMHELRVDLRTLVMDARQTVFSNFFVAKPAFWREWLLWNERLFSACEGPPSPLQAALTQPTSYPGAVQRKVFLMERVASLLLATQPQWRVTAANPFKFAWSMTRFRDHPTEAFISDALKAAYRDRGWPEYLQAFGRVREAFAAGTRAFPG